MHEQENCCDQAVSHQLPIAAALWIIQIVSTEECWSLMQNVMQNHCSTHSNILNTTATQYACSLNHVYHPHWLVQWSHRCSCTRILVHSLWLPGHINANVAQTILIILTRLDFFWTGLVNKIFLNEGSLSILLNCSLLSQRLMPHFSFSLKWGPRCLDFISFLLCILLIFSRISSIPFP